MKYTQTLKSRIKTCRQKLRMITLLHHLRLAKAGIWQGLVRWLKVRITLKWQEDVDATSVESTDLPPQVVLRVATGGLFGNIFNVFILSKMCLTLTWIQHINSKHTFYEKTKHLIYAILPMIQLCEPANLTAHMHNNKLGC